MHVVLKHPHNPRGAPGGPCVLKYDAFGAKLLKCSRELSRANLLKWVTPPAKLLKSISSLGLYPSIGYPGISWDIVGYRLFSHKGLHSAPWAEARAKLLKLALPSWGGGEQNC